MTYIPRTGTGDSKLDTERLGKVSLLVDNGFVPATCCTVTGSRTQCCTLLAFEDSPTVLVIDFEMFFSASSK